MFARLMRSSSWGVLALTVFGCSGGTALPALSGYGPSPQLPSPHASLIPTVRIAPATGWPAGARPVAAEGLAVSAFAEGLNHPRWLYVLPNGDVLVAETNAPAHPAQKPRGLRDWVMGMVMKRAGAAVPSPDRIVLLRDSDGDGVAETRTVFLDHVSSPFGITLAGGQLYVAATDAVLRYPYTPGQTRMTEAGVKVTDLPGGPINHHWTKNIVASPDGAQLYVTVGSNSNVGENGMAAEAGRAAIWRLDPATGGKTLFATGLRNPNGMDFDPATGRLWTVVNERDEIGDDLVPDYLTSVREGGFYGWPYSYYGQHVDTRVRPQRPDLVATATVPDYALGAHSASLGLAFYRGGLLPDRYRGGAFIGQHGSWNRSVPAGYQVIFVPFAGGRPAGTPQPVLTGFLDAKGQAQGRPVGVVADKSGALLVADDVGDKVWRVTSAAPAATSSREATAPASVAAP